ncbi:hypothetical protein LTS10_010839 [Elasticomyces elasticus]|nr:hypothetical protein LTS10_010839 [Elasticomyces elasticus]
MVEIPLPYTANPILLLILDVTLFFCASFSCLGLFGIVWPLVPWPSGKLDELAITCGNARAIIIHGFLFLAQFATVIAAIVSLLTFVVPTPVYFTGLIVAITVNQWVCRALLDGRPGQTFYAGQKYASNPKDPGKLWVSEKHLEERWVFINGVAVGHSTHWMNSNLARLSSTFRRPVLGIHNPTYGIVYDVLETIIQRTFGYATLDIRTAYSTISALLRDQNVKKLILIAHSQGAVEAGMVLDWLYQTLTWEELGKLEVYTFGNAANHWNCPERRKRRVIQHIEHYANRRDWVARFGVLYFRGLGSRIIPGFARTAMSTLRNRFVGTLFVKDASGHMFNQHYLDTMFPMKLASDGQHWEVDDDAEYMNMRVDTTFYRDYGMVVVRNRALAESSFKVHDLSRLWQYRNGQVPTVYKGMFENASMPRPCPVAAEFAEQIGTTYDRQKRAVNFRYSFSSTVAELFGIDLTSSDMSCAASDIGIMSLIENFTEFQ